MSPPDKYGKRRQITFRIGPIAEDRLKLAAALFNMKPSEYAKAVLYQHLGVFNEPLDQRRRSWRKKKTYAKTDSETDIDSEFEPGRGSTMQEGSRRIR